MSEVKRYACITASGIGGVKVCESINGKFVMHEDYAALQQKLEAECANLRQAIDAVLVQRDALAVENGALKQWATLTGELWENGCELDGHLDDIPENPATEAWVNKVRAEGVDMIADAVGAKCAGLNAGSKDWKALKNIVFMLVDFAEQLRSGGAK